MLRHLSLFLPHTLSQPAPARNSQRRMDLSSLHRESCDGLWSTVISSVCCIRCHSNIHHFTFSSVLLWRAKYRRSLPGVGEIHHPQPLFLDHQTFLPVPPTPLLWPAGLKESSLSSGKICPIGTAPGCLSCRSVSVCCRNNRRLNHDDWNYT